MKVTQMSDWSSEPCSNLPRQNSARSKSTQPRDNAWAETENESRSR